MELSVKSKLFSTLAPTEQANDGSGKTIDTFVVDLIAHYQTISTNLPKKFEELIIRFLKSLQRNYSRANLAADSYKIRRKRKVWIFVKVIGQIF